MISRLTTFRKITKFIKVKENSTFSTSDPLSSKLLTRFRLCFSHLNEHKFRHNVRDTVNSMLFSLSLALLFTLLRSSFLNRIFEINVEFRNMNGLTRRSFLLFGLEKQSPDVNTKMLNLTIQFLKDSGHFDDFLIWYNEQSGYF